MSPLSSPMSIRNTPVQRREINSLREGKGHVRRHSSNSNGVSPGHAQPSDFEMIKLISRGAFGTVYLSRKKATGDVYAMKTLKKDVMVRKNMVKHVLTERNILVRTQNPFVVKLYYSFQSAHHLYLVMEYCPGGDLASLLQKMQWFPEQMAKQYLAEALLALEYLHDHGIVHRDLKPDNMLLDREGHIKLTDFGLSRLGLIELRTSRENSISEEVGGSWSNKTATGRHSSSKRVVGTPDYLAPEALLGTGHGKEVDFWALGAILFEFITGCPPFNDENPQAIFENILSLNIPWIELPEDTSEEAKDLIAGLLAENSEERMGSEKRGGVDALKRAQWFKGINWDTVLEQPSLFVPKLNDATDTGYFWDRTEMYGRPSDHRLGSENAPPPIPQNADENMDELGSSLSSSVTKESTNTNSTRTTEGGGEKGGAGGGAGGGGGRTRYWNNFSFTNTDLLHNLSRSNTNKQNPSTTPTTTTDCSPTISEEKEEKEV